VVARRVSQVVVETEVLNETPVVRVSQALVEAEINQHRDVLISQVVVEVEIEAPTAPATPEAGVAGLGTPRPYTAQLYRRNPAGPMAAVLPLPSPLRLRVTEIAYTAMGGCELATIEAAGPEAALWQLANCLLSGVEIFDGHDARVWWGYVDELVVNAGGVTFGVSAAELANRVAVAYAYTPVGSSTSTRETTEWAEDAESIAEYGTFERLESLDQAETIEAETRRDTVLAQYYLPIPTIDTGSEDLGATLTCRGWYRLLEHRLYENAGTAEVETTAQIEDVVGTAGEQLEGAEILDESGVDTNEYRDGDGNAWEQVTSLLETGTSDGLRLLCRVTPGRALQVYAEPMASVADYMLTAEGWLLDRYSRPVRPSPDVVGRWARLRDVVPASVDMTMLADPSLVFIESATYDVEAMRYRFEQRGRSVWDIGGVERR